METLPLEIWEQITIYVDLIGYHSMRMSHRSLQIPFIQSLPYGVYWKEYLRLKKLNIDPTKSISLHMDSINDRSFIGILRICDWVGGMRCLQLQQKLSTKSIQTAFDILYYHAHECRQLGYAEFSRKLYRLGRVADDYQTQDLHSMCDNLFIKLYSHTGDVEIVEKLVRNPIVDPASDNNLAFYAACIHGHLPVVKLLLPFAELISIESACQYGQTRIVEFLIHSGVDPTFPYNYPFIRACERGNVAIALLLLSHPKVDPFVLNHEALYRACLEGQKNAVELLLQQDFNECSRAAEIIEVSKNKGYDEIVDILLRDRRFQII
jgi:hypothetical protein